MVKGMPASRPCQRQAYIVRSYHVETLSFPLVSAPVKYARARGPPVTDTVLVRLLPDPCYDHIKYPAI